MLRKLLFVCLLYALPAYSQQPVTFDIRQKSMYLPAPQRSGKFHHSLSLIQVYLPHQWLEQSVSGPMVAYKANYALPAGLALNGTFRTLLIANVVQLGPSWNYSLTEHVHLGLAYQASFEFGMLKAFGYNNTMRVWQHQPSIRLGYSFRDIAFTLQGRLDWMMGTRLALEDYATSNITGSMFNGYSAGLFIEQRLTRNKAIGFGFLANFNKFNILGWPALMIVDHRYFIPEIAITFKL